MKKLLALFLALTLPLALAACGQPPAEDPAANAAVPAQEAAAAPAEADPAAGQQDPEQMTEGEKQLNAIHEQEKAGQIDSTYILSEGGQAEGEFSLAICGHAFTADEAASAGLALHTGTVTTYTSVEPHDYTYVGYRLKEVLDYYDIPLEGSFYVKADDGYKIEIQAAEIDDNTMIALSRNGKTNNAPIYAPCSSQLAPNYVSGFCEFGAL